MTTLPYRLPPDLAADIAAYEQDVQRYLAGELPAALLKAKRVPRGVYEQRQDGTFMVRVRVAGGVLGHAQARELAALGREFGDGLLHVTTRQDLQFHGVAIRDTPTIMRRLLAVGLTSKGGGGNTVRNITACPYAGVCPRERFDVTPLVQAVTEYLIALPGSYNLPRKYKIAFSGCAADCALAQVADLGFLAEVRGGQPGFRVLAGGGLGAHSRVADPLLDWTPVTDTIRAAETVRRLFDELGDRTNKHRARLRHVFERIGAAAFRERYAQRHAEAVREGVPEWQGAAPLGDPADAGTPSVPRPESVAGVRVVRQRQPGFVTVPLHLPLGFLPSADLARVGELAERFSAEAGVRATQSQNLLLRFVRETDLPALVAGLRALGTEVLTPKPLDRFVACAGASTCRLGICLARNAAQACAAALGDAGLAPETLDALAIHINGCPNACGQQPVAALGLFGGAHRAGERLVPAYLVTVGGRCDASGARLGKPVGKVPAAALPGFVRDVALDYETHRAPGDSFLAYADRRGVAHFESLAGRHAIVPPPEERPDFYRDLGAAGEFSLAGRGAGECGAGVFEVIQQDLAAARRAAAPFDILLPTARALLITRGVDAQEPDTVLREFERHFVDSGLVAAEFRALLSRARGHTQGWQTALDGEAPAIRRLLERVELLYTTLDASLAFHPPEARAPAPAPQAAAPATDTVAPTAELDLRGVPCPMNFVKAKLRLESLDVGDTLAVVLDDGEPIGNVPASLRAEGHEIVASRDLGEGHWRVVVKKKR